MARKKKAGTKSKRSVSKAKKRPGVKRVGKAIRRKLPAKAGSKSKPAKAAGPEMEKIGEVSHYFPHVKAAAVKMLKDGLKVGESILIKGHTTDFKEKVKSIQLDHVPIEEGKKGQEIGLLVKSRVRIGDAVYRI